jgi:hypothetical protein
MPRLCCRAGHMKWCTPKLARARKCGKGAGGRRGKKGSIGRRGAEVRSAPKRLEFWSWRESFHAAAVTTGGERSWISAAVSLSMTFIGPPHFGQRQESGESSVEEAPGSAGA